MQKRAFNGLQNTPKCVYGRGSATDPAGKFTTLLILASRLGGDIPLPTLHSASILQPSALTTRYPKVLRLGGGLPPKYFFSRTARVDCSQYRLHEQKLVYCERTSSMTLLEVK